MSTDSSQQSGVRIQKGPGWGFCLLAALFWLLFLTVPAAADRARLPYTILYFHTSPTPLTADRYLIANASSNSATEALTQMPVPVNGIFKELRCHFSAANDSDEVWTLSLRVNGATTALTCTIGASAQTCTDLVNSVPVALGDLINLLADNTAGNTPSAVVNCTVVLYEYF